MPSLICINLSRGSGKFSSPWSWVNAQMRISLTLFSSTLSSLPLNDRVYVLVCSQSLSLKGYQFTSHALRLLTRALITLPLVEVFSFLFVFGFFIKLVCILTAFICILTALSHFSFTSKCQRNGSSGVWCSPQSRR